MNQLHDYPWQISRCIANRKYLGHHKEEAEGSSHQHHWGGEGRDDQAVEWVALHFNEEQMLRNYQKQWLSHKVLDVIGCTTINYFMFEQFIFIWNWRCQTQMHWRERFKYRYHLREKSLAKAWPSPQIWMFFWKKFKRPWPPSLFGNYIAFFFCKSL